MKRYLLGLLALITSASAAPVAEITAPYRPDEVIVQFRAEAPAADRQRVLDGLGATGVRRLGGLRARHARISGVSVAEAIARYRDDPAVEFIEPDYLYGAQETPDDPGFNLLWGLSNRGQTGGTPGSDISATRVWDLFTGADEVLVAIIDTGVDYRHPDLAANIYVNPGEIEGNGIDDDGNGFVDDVRGWDFANHDNDPFDDHGHGTHVAGTVGAVGNNGTGVVGVNWHVRLLPLKFLSADGFGSTSAAVQAIDYATRAGARIMNNSWGGHGFSHALALAIERAEAAGALFVAAAGNSTPPVNNDLQPFYPASYELDNVIAVAATDSSDRLAGFSNYGAMSVDLSAPGVDIYSTFPDNDYGFLNGTSMATPHVSGALALLVGRYPGINPADAKALLLDHVDPVDSLRGLTRTGGRLNAFLPMADPDDVAPAPVVDLATVEPESHRIDLEWTATGDDGMEGQATRYDVRYATTPIDEASFAAASRATGLPRPAPPGGRERARVQGLLPATAYYFAVKVLDEFGNASPISNVVIDATLGPPRASVTPESLEVELFTGESDSRSLTLHNSGAGELLFEVTVDPLTAAPLRDAVAALPAFVASRGPAACSGSPAAHPQLARHPVDAGAPVADWEPAGSGIKEVTDATAANGTRYSYHEYDAPGGHYTGIYQPLHEAQPRYVSFWIRSGSAAADDGYFVLRDAKGQETIFFFATSSGTFYVNADVGGHSSFPYEAQTWYHIEFRDIDFSARRFDYYVDGRLLQAAVPFRWPDVQSLARLDLYSFETDAEAWWDEIVISTEQPPFPVSVAPAGGVVPAGGSVDLGVVLTASGLNGGEYAAPIRLRTNDPERPEIVVPTRMRVTGAPDIGLSETALDFGRLLVGASKTLTLTLTNSGTDLLTVGSLQIDRADFSIDPQGPLTLPPRGIRDLRVTLTAEGVGPIDGRLTVASNDPDEPVLSVPLTGEGLFPPDIRVTPESVSRALFTGERASETVIIENTGYSELIWELAFPGEPHPDLERVRLALNERVGEILERLPERFLFNGGDWGKSIVDGGRDMYAGGNFLSTDVANFLDYSDDRIRQSVIFGAGGRYFTRKFPGLFVLAADAHRVRRFTISGSLGGSGEGQVDASVLRTRINGVTYLGFVKRVFHPERPSVNHLIVAVEQPGVDHRYSVRPESDLHEVFDLSDNRRLYYLLFAGRDGFYYDDARMLEVMRAFVELLPFAPDWLRALPVGGLLLPGERSDVGVALDAAGLVGGDYATEIHVLSNVPQMAELSLPVSLEVTSAPDIELGTKTLSFGTAFVAVPSRRELSVSNVGADRLTIQAVTTDDPDFVPEVVSLELAPGETRLLGVTLTASRTGAIEASLSLATDDPDESELFVALVADSRPPPEIRVSPEALDVELAAGATATRTLDVTNVSGSQLSFRVEATFGGLVAAGDESPAETDAVVPPRTEPAPLPSPAAGSATPRSGNENAAAGWSAPAGFFNFSDDFEDGVLDGWQGVSLPAFATEAELVAPSAPRERSAAVGVRGRTPLPSSGAPAVNGDPSPETGALALIRVSPPSGTVVAGSSATISVTVDASHLNAGEYEGSVLVTSNDPYRPLVVVPVRIAVVGKPEIATSVSRLDFGRVPLGLSVTRPFTITNFGSDLLTVFDIAADDPAFAPNTTSFALLPGTSRGVVVTFTPDELGLVEGELTVISDSGSGRLLLSLAGEGISPPVLRVAPEHLDAEQFAGATRSQTLTVRNSGGEPLQFDVALQVQGAAAGPHEIILFEDDMEAGPVGWTSEVYRGDELWHLTTSNFASPDTSWWCGVEGQTTYATGKPVSTALISPPIDLRGVSTPIRMHFRERHQTEPLWDQCMVDASIDGGTSWTALRGAYGSAPSGDNRGWNLQSLDLSAFAGHVVRVRFYMETFDATNNEFAGWFVDDLRVTAVGAPWISVTPEGGTVPPGGSVDLDVHFDTARFRPPGVYEATIGLASNDPFRALVHVPTRLRVLDAPFIMLPGATVRAESSLDHFGSSSHTVHGFDMPRPPGGDATVELLAEGDFGDAARTATATAEALVLGAAGNTGEGCGTAEAAFVVRAPQLVDLVADGSVRIEVRNSHAVGTDCPVSRHVVRLAYPVALERLDFGEVAIGTSRTLPLTVANGGGSPLEIHTIASAAEEVTVSATSAAVPPRTEIELAVTLEPRKRGPFEAVLHLASNDPRQPLLALPLAGSAIDNPAEARLTPDSIAATLPPRATLTGTETLHLANVGRAELQWSAEPLPWGSVEPNSGTVPPGGEVEIRLLLSAAELDAGEYHHTLVLHTNDPAHERLELPVTLRVGEVDLALFRLDFSPKYADRAGTVEAILQPPAGYLASEIVVATVSIAGVHAESWPLSLVDTNRDRVPELVVQFDAEQLVPALPQGSVREVAITGELRDRSWFKATTILKGIIEVAE